MKHLAIFVATIFSMSIFAPRVEAQPQPFIGIVESVEAKVNEEVITTSEVDERLQRVEMVELRRPIRDQREYDRYRQRELEQLIQESLLVQEARRRGFKMEEKQLEAAVEERWEQRVQAQGGEESIRQFLEETGISEDVLKGQLADEIERSYLQERVLRAEVSSQLQVTPQEIEEFKRENPGLLDQLEQVDLSHILIAVPEDATPEQEAEARRKAEDLVTEIRARGGDAFERLAQEYSDHESTREKGGRLGIIRPGELTSEFDVAFDMFPGEVSDPIRTSQGFHILKVNDKRTIAERLRQKNLHEAAQEFLNKLREDAVIVVKGAAPSE